MDSPDANSDAISKPICRDCQKMEGRFKDKITSLLKTKATENYIKLTRAKNVYKGKKIIKAS